MAGDMETRRRDSLRHPRLVELTTGEYASLRATGSQSTLGLRQACQKRFAISASPDRPPLCPVTSFDFDSFEQLPANPHAALHRAQAARLVGGGPVQNAALVRCQILPAAQ